MANKDLVKNINKRNISNLQQMGIIIQKEYWKKVAQFFFICLWKNKVISLQEFQESRKTSILQVLLSHACFLWIQTIQ